MLQNVCESNSVYEEAPKSEYRLTPQIFRFQERRSLYLASNRFYQFENVSEIDIVIADGRNRIPRASAAKTLVRRALGSFAGLIYLLLQPKRAKLAAVSRCY